MRYALLFSLLFTLVFTSPLFTYLDQPLGHTMSGYGDILLDYFVFEHNLSKISSLDFAHFLDTRMYYPLKNTWAFGNTYLPQSILSLPVFLISKNAILATNFAIVINFLLSFLAMYALVYYLTKNVGGAILSGLIYTFNPYVWSHIHQLDLAALQWIPLIFLCTEKLIKKVSWLPILLLSSLLLIQLSSSTYYIFFVFITLPVYFSVRIYLVRVNIGQFFQIKVFVGLAMFVILASLYLKPFMEVKNTYQVTRDLDTIRGLSARLSDFIFTTSDNRLYGGMIKFRDEIIQSTSTEHSLFPGITVYFLLGISIYLFVKYKNLGLKKPLVISSFVLLITSLLLSFGPQAYIYLIIYYLPFADSLRVISRFVVISFFSASLIIGLSWSLYADGLKKLKNWLLIMIIILISLEYLYIVPRPYPIRSEISDFYAWLNNSAKLEVILELPMANWWGQYPNLSREPFADYIYLLYATLHSKQIVNGAQAVIPFDKIVLGRQLSVNFPTEDKLEQLKDMGVDILIVHREEYNDPKMGEEVIVKLRQFGLEEAYQSDNISAFLLEVISNPPSSSLRR